MTRQTLTRTDTRTELVPAGQLARHRRAVHAAGGRIVRSSPVGYDGGYAVTYTVPAR